MGRLMSQVAITITTNANTASSVNWDVHWLTMINMSPQTRNVNDSPLETKFTNDYGWLKPQAEILNFLNGQPFNYHLLLLQI
jgi:hypothetical protein